MADSVETIDWETLIAEAEAEEYPEIEHIAYTFSKKTFKETDQDGIYNSTKPN